MNFIAGQCSSAPVDEAVLKRIEARFWIPLFLICTKHRGHMGKQSQAPKQVWGAVALHAVCQE